jgi:hypothetical protein
MNFTPGLTPTWRANGASALAPAQDQRVLANSLDVLDVGLEIWDEDDCLLLHNRAVNRLLYGFYTPAMLGQPFEVVLRAQIACGLFPAALGCEAKWLTQRLAARGDSRSSQLMQLAGGRWVRLHESRNSESGLVTGWVDMTEQMHASQASRVQHPLQMPPSSTEH